nr:uncharacterized mitochondrial protein AtMg00820-like [Tanacetum cinerariifolium]
MAEALKDVGWVIAMQDKLDQFARLKVWRLVPKPEDKTVIKTKWIFKNKKDEKDDEDDDMDIEADEEEEEEHPAPADSVVVASTAVDQAPSAEETELFKTDESAATPPPHPAYRMTTMISIPAPVPLPAWSDSEIVRLLAIPAGGLRADYGFVDTIDREIMRDPERETVISEMLRADHRRSTEIIELRTALRGQVTALQGQAMIDQGVTAALAERDALRSTNDEDSHNFGTGVRRTERANREWVTYTDISSPFEELSDIGSPRADDHEHLELPEMLEDPYVEVALQAPPSPDYIPGPEEPEQAPPSPDYLPEYVLESDLEAHPEDDNDEDPEEDPVDYPADVGDDGDDEEGSSEDDKDDDMDIEADEEEEEEHPDPADSVVVASTAADQALSAEETDPFETDEFAATPPPHPAYRMTARISIPAQVPMPAWSDSKVVRLLAMSSPPSSPLSPWSSPPPQIPFPPLPPILSPPSPVLSPAPPPSPIRTPLLLPISASTSSLPLQLPSASRREDRPEVTLPPRKRLGIALGPEYEVGESSSAAAARPAGGLMADYGFVATMDREIMRDPEREVGYGITDSWDEILETLQGAPVSTDTELGGYMREFETRVRQDTEEIYMRLDDEQSERQLLVGRLNMLFRDRRAHVYTRHLMETEARLSQEAWVRSTDASDLVVVRRQIMISELLRAYHRRSTEIIELRTALQGQVTALQGQVIALQAQVTALQGQQGLA